VQALEISVFQVLGNIIEAGSRAENPKVDSTDIKIPTVRFIAVYKSSIIC
jgi:hypothetical protein